MVQLKNDQLALLQLFRPRKNSLEYFIHGYEMHGSEMNELKRVQIFMSRVLRLRWPQHRV